MMPLKSISQSQGLRHSHFSLLLNRHYKTNLISVLNNRKAIPQSHPFTTFRFAHKMLTKKLGSMKKLAKKVKVVGNAGSRLEPSHYECLLGDKGGGGGGRRGASPTGSTATTPTGTFVMYVGEDRQRFVVPTSYLSHPLFKILLDRAYDEFGFDQRNGLVVPCSVAAFQEVINAVECCNGRFEFGDLFHRCLGYGSSLATGSPLSSLDVM